MKSIVRIIRKAGMILLTALAILMANWIATSLADEEPVVVELHVVPEPTPEPVPYVETRKVEVRDHALNQRDVETLAEFLWKSPLRYESTKRTLLWVVFNRIDDRSGLFADTIEDVCRDRREFAFMTAHRYALSEDNLRIAREELNKWLTLKEGGYIGPHCPRSGVYCGFCGDRNRNIKVYSEIGGDPLTW